MDDNKLNEQYNLEEFREKSFEYYKKIKGKLESKYLGKFAAISYEVKDFEIGDTITEALTRAREKYPEKLFYVIQVGTNATFSIQATKDKFMHRKALL